MADSVPDTLSYGISSLEFVGGAVGSRYSENGRPVGDWLVQG